MDEANVQEVFADEEFVKKLFELETPEEVQAALREKDITLSTQEIIKVRDLLLKRTETEAELSDEELADVTGGLLTEILVAVSVALGLFAAAAAGTGIAIASTHIATRGTW